MGSVGPTKSISSSNEAYENAQRKFSAEGLPKDPKGWVARASEVADVVATTAVERDLNNTSPVAEVALLKASGLTNILGPTQYGGGGQRWDIAYKAIRNVARGDGSIGMILGYHLLWSTVANVVGTKEQQDRIQKDIIENTWFIGGAVNPRDADLVITDNGEEIIFNGLKHFSTGGVISDVTWLEGGFEGVKEHIFALVPSSKLNFSHNWDAIGLKGTESGSVRIENVNVSWSDALGWDAKTKKPIESILHIPFATLMLPTIQLVFSNFYLGIGQGALDTAKAWTNKHTRAWPYGGDNKDLATDEFYILSRYGSFQAHLLAAEALADRAGEAIAQVYEDHGEKRDVSPRRRGEVAEAVVAVKIVTTDTSLRVAGGVFEVTGSKSTGRKVGLDRFWRDIRTHTLHDPVAYKEKELGRYVLLDEVPEPTWYT